jgi:hypothetical protein
VRDSPAIIVTVKGNQDVGQGATVTVAPTIVRMSEGNEGNEGNGENEIIAAPAPIV